MSQISAAQPLASGMDDPQTAAVKDQHRHHYHHTRTRSRWSTQDNSTAIGNHHGFFTPKTPDKRRIDSMVNGTTRT